MTTTRTAPKPPPTDIDPDARDFACGILSAAVSALYARLPANQRLLPPIETTLAIIALERAAEILNRKFGQAVPVDGDRLEAQT